MPPTRARKLPPPHQSSMEAGSRFAVALEAAIRNAGGALEVANLCGVSLSAVYQWRNGETKNLRQEHYFAVCKAAGMSPHWVATGEGRQTPYAYTDDILGFLDKLASLDDAKRQALRSFLDFQLSSKQ